MNSVNGPIDISVVIVSWNVSGLLRDCLNSLADDVAGGGVEAIVIDSFSADDSVAMVQSEFPWVRLVAEPHNVGFARGSNIGIEMASGSKILILNPDTVVSDGALAAMGQFMDDDPGLAVVGPTLRSPGGTIQSSRRRFPTFVLALFESTWFQRFAPKSLIDSYFFEELPYDMPAEVDWISGACMLVRREAIAEVGTFDEAYYMYSEELDWCRRFKDAGWKVAYTPSAVVMHYEGKSSEQAVEARHKHFQRAKLRYFAKYHGMTRAQLLRLFLLMTYLTQIVVEGAKWLLGHRRPLRAQRISVYLGVLRSGLRPAGYK